jgi:hypothetical protein
LNGEDVAARHSYISENQLLTENRRRAVAEAYPVVLKAARTQAIKQLKAARPVVEKLSESMAEVAQLLNAIRQCRDAANAGNPEGRVSYQDPRLTVETFLKLVVTGGDPVSILI